MCGGLFFFSLVSGVVLSNSGKPYPGAIFTVHKLVALGTVIVIGRSVYHLYGAVGVRALAPVILAVAGLAFLALFVSGGLLSIRDSLPAAVLRIHQVAPLLALVSVSIAFYLVLSSPSYQR
jgi:hypothetical protein